MYQVDMRIRHLQKQKLKVQQIEIGWLDCFQDRKCQYTEHTQSNHHESLYSMYISTCYPVRLIYHVGTVLCVASQM